VKDVRVGKQIIIDLDTENIDEVFEEIGKMSETLLANTVIEDYTIEIEELE